MVGEIKGKNNDIDTENRRLDNIQTKVTLTVAPNENILTNPEIAVIKINNYREEAMASNVTGQPGSTRLQKMENRKESPNSLQHQESTIQHRDSNENINDASEQFSVEKIPLKVQLVKPDNCSGGPVIVYHSEAVYALRKQLIEQARKTFRELEKAQTNDLLNHSNQITKVLEEKFEEDLIKNQGYGKGHLFSDNNCKIIFKTFLKE